MRAWEIKAPAEVAASSTAPPRRQIPPFTPEQLQEEIWLNLVGTFGVGSAGYWWGRAGPALLRLTHYLVGWDDALWALLFSDDGAITGRTARYERGLLLHLLTLVVVGAPIAWKNMHGVVQAE